MPFVNLAGILNHARRHQYGIGAFNVPEYETLQALLDAAVEMQSPLIVDVAEVHLKYIDLDDVAYVVRRAAERAPVPVALHLDHGENFETIMRAVRAGFTSVMFDGSHLPYEENVRETAEIVRICHAMGVTVEAELGEVLGGEGTSERFEADPSLYTDPAQAEDFVRRTGLDALAISFGTAHGLYRGTPKLDFPRLEEISRRTQIPVVLHGGTGVTDEDFRKAISLGIAKINFYTQISVDAVEAARQMLAGNPDLVSYPQLLTGVRKVIQQTVMRQMQIFGSAGICARFPDLCHECQVCYPPNQSIGQRTPSREVGYHKSGNPSPSSHVPAEGGDAANGKLSQSDVTELIEAVTQAVLKGLKGSHA